MNAQKINWKKKISKTHRRLLPQNGHHLFELVECERTRSIDVKCAKYMYDFGWRDAQERHQEEEFAKIDQISRGSEESLKKWRNQGDRPWRRAAVIQRENGISKIGESHVSEQAVWGWSRGRRRVCPFVDTREDIKDFLRRAPVLDSVLVILLPIVKEVFLLLSVHRARERERKEGEREKGGERNGSNVPGRVTIFRFGLGLTRIERRRGRKEGSWRNGWIGERGVNRNGS